MTRVILAAIVAPLLVGCPKADVIEVDAGSAPTDHGALAIDVPALDVGDDDVPAIIDLGAPIADVPDVVDAPAARDLGPPRTLACGSTARVDDPMGDTVVVGNEAGGEFTLVVDTAITNVGVIARGPVALTLNGDHLSGVRVVHFVGEGAAASTLYAPREVALERGGTPAAPLNDVTGHATMACANDCSPGVVASDHGCNSSAQITTYFQRRFGDGRRMLHLQTSTFDGLYIFASRGGCCLP